VAEPLKNQFDRALLERLARRLHDVHPEFDESRFVDTLAEALPPLELKDRINRVADELRAALPDDYPTALAIVVDAAVDPDIEGFPAWPLCSFVERHGLDHPAASLAAMESLTRSFSCEFAIRPYLEHHLEAARASMRRWTASPDEAVRRLPSEGTRPHLPWGPKVDALLADPGIGIELLELLRHDPSETVRRSVANHLNDIARNHPDLVVEICTRWRSDPAIEPSMIRHALRSLVKKGHPGALAVLGFTTSPEVDVSSFSIDPSALWLGDSITLTTTLVSTASTSQRLVVDFVVHHVGASGTTTPKVFKWTTLDLGPGESVTLRKRRKIATASTRRYHAGAHRVELQVAGEARAEGAFELLDSSPR